MCKCDKNYVLNGDLILRKITHKGCKTLVPYVPVGPVRTDSMTAIHNDPAAGHLGFKRSKNRVRKRFFWEGMDKDLKTHICNCPCKLYISIQGCAPGFLWTVTTHRQGTQIGLQSGWSSYLPGTTAWPQQQQSSTNRYLRSRAA